MKKKNLVTALLVASMLVGTVGVTSTPAEAKSKIKLSTEVEHIPGGTALTVKLKGTKKKVKWSVISGKKRVKITNKKKTSVKVVGVKKGTAKVQAKLGKKKYIFEAYVNYPTPAKTITITKADAQTVKTVHDTFNTGKAVNLKVKGSKSSACKVMRKLAKAIGEYNKFDVTPQYRFDKYKLPYTVSYESPDSGYRIYPFPSEDSRFYKNGLQLVKNIVNETKKKYANDRAEKAERIKELEAKAREQYAVGTDNYVNIFYRVTDMFYSTYLEATTAKSKTLKCYGKYYYNGDKYYTLPNDYYYITYKDKDGNIQYWYKDVTLLYNEYEVEEGDYDNYSLVPAPCVNEDALDYVKLSDVTFHYEPLKVDTSAIDKVIEAEVKEAVKSLSGYGEDTYTPSTKEPIETTQFYKLSQAMQAYYISGAFKDDWQGQKVKYWAQDMFRLLGLGLRDFDLERCDICNGMWHTVRLTNSKGQKAWVRYQYNKGIDIDAVATKKRFRHSHNKKFDLGRIEGFIN